VKSKHSACSSPTKIDHESQRRIEDNIAGERKSPIPSSIPSSHSHSMSMAFEPLVVAVIK
jgi:hypothetical protein